MKRLKILATAASFLFLLGGAAWAEMTTIYGPVYVAKTKHDGHERETKLRFTAPVPGNGVIVIKNGGDAGKRARVSSAEVELNDVTIAHKHDFNKNVDELRFNVQLKANNELEVEVKSCKECELAITVLGEKPAPPPAPPMPPMPPGLPFPPTGPLAPPAPPAP